jgi:hypothetical protein
MQTSNEKSCLFGDRLNLSDAEKFDNRIEAFVLWSSRWHFP